MTATDIKPKNILQRWTLRTPGLLLALAVALFSVYISGFKVTADLGFSPLTVSIAIGFILGNLLFTFWPGLMKKCRSGVTYSEGTLLKLGIVLYGLQVTVQEIYGIGVGGFLTDIFIVITTVFLTYKIGTKLLKMDKDLALLIGIGSSICGGAAIISTEPILRAGEEKMSVAVATIVVFGTFSIFLYPLLSVLFAQIGLPHSQTFFGIYIGATVQAVAQVLAAAHVIGGPAQAAALITKLLRVMMLAPMLILLPVLYLKHKKAPAGGEGSEPHHKRKIIFPWFALIFMLMPLITSAHLLSPGAKHVIFTLDEILLSMALGSLGLLTRIASIKEAGFKPLILGGIITVWLVCAGGLVSVAAAHLTGMGQTALIHHGSTAGF